MDNQWKYSPQNRRSQAIRSLVGEPCAFDMDGDKIINWREPEGKQPSDEDIETKVTEYKKLWDDQEYARKREAEYPSIAELTVALYAALLLLPEVRNRHSLIAPVNSCLSDALEKVASSCLSLSLCI